MKAETPVGERKKFKCAACNWKFSRNFTPQLCPYCGKACVVLDVLKTADALIEEIRI